ncbi:MAG: 1-deoxy-D-xylulose-5-phosphate synthase [Lachnospiraceae bacterium]|jgi:1-deoxy-D-xylulose-5-phosphate synthase|nr:1-deoxy-D-xylulose-5-phosphate synthase [Lachnospiraceae bacterium]
MPKILDSINHANDIKKIRKEDYAQLSQEIRDFLLEKVSEKGGHLASNLGVVELTMALHLFLNFPEDQLVWDVGHQAYVHKILTGRKDGFDTLRQLDGMSGFPKCKESAADAFNTGHSSTSISAALGMARARDLLRKNNKVVAVIGDGALSGGMAFEALNNAARLKTNMIVVLNDNNMSISENVGGMATYLGKLRTDVRYTKFKTGVEQTIMKMPQIGNALMGTMRRSKESIKRLMVPGMLFEDMGITYLGPIDGHNITGIYSMLERAQRVKGTVIVHVITKKGKGYRFAEKYPSHFHGVNPFDVTTGKSKSRKAGPSYTDIFSKKLMELAKDNKRIAAITAAMPSGTGLQAFKEHFPSRFTDVGIAEEHAVTYAAGMAKAGMIPIVAIYSTFMQRAYDQILHDVCLGEFPVVFILDRAGIVGNDGETHQGIFDLSFLGSIPNLTIVAPKNAAELEKMLEFAVSFGKPIAMRFPRGTAYLGMIEQQEPLVYGKSEVLHEGSKVALLAVGSMVKHAEKVRELLQADHVDATVVNARFVKPIDEELIEELAQNHSLLVTMEENVEHGGYGQSVASFICDHNLDLRHINISVKDNFVEHGKVYELYQRLGLDPQSVYEKIIESL